MATKDIELGVEIGPLGGVYIVTARNGKVLTGHLKPLAYLAFLLGSAIHAVTGRYPTWKA